MHLNKYFQTKYLHLKMITKINRFIHNLENLVTLYLTLKSNKTILNNKDNCIYNCTERRECPLFIPSSFNRNIS